MPLLKEQGVRDAEADSWLALFAPAATPAPVVAALAKAVLEILAKPDVAAAAIKQGIAVNLRTPSAFAIYHAAEFKKWADVVKSANVKVDG